MRKQSIIIGVVILVVCVSLSGCNQVDDTVTIEKNKFVGTWKNTIAGFTTTFNLFANGTCKVNSGNGTWDLKDGKFVLIPAVTGEPNIYTYVFSNNDRTLSLTFTSGGETFIFTKQ